MWEKVGESGTMFVGEFTHNLDSKSRISLPARFRDSLGGECVVTRGLDKCLWIYPRTDWEKLASKISSLPITSKNARSFSRFILSGAIESHTDKVGRISIPGFLRDYSGIKNKAVVTGAYDHIEVWSEDEWKSFKGEMEDRSEEIAETITSLQEDKTNF